MIRLSSSFERLPTLELVAVNPRSFERGAGDVIGRRHRLRNPTTRRGLRPIVKRLQLVGLDCSAFVRPDCGCSERRRARRVLAERNLFFFFFFWALFGAKKGGGL